MRSWQMRRETQAHSDKEKPKVPGESEVKQKDHPERAKIPQSKREDGMKTARREDPTMGLTKETVSGP